MKAQDRVSSAIERSMNFVLNDLTILLLLFLSSSHSAHKGPSVNDLNIH